MDDITFCLSDCQRTDCYRHPSNIQDRTIPHSYADFKGTETCPVQPNLQPTCNQLATDCISRQAAIDEIEMLLEQSEDYEHDKTWNDAIRGSINAIKHHVPSVQLEIIRCEECRWGREVCGNIECFVDSNIPPEYHGYDWFCPNGERRTDE